MSMKPCLDAVVRYQRRKEDEHVTRVATPGTHRNIKYDEELNQFLGIISPWLADVFMTEYKFAIEVAKATYTMEDDDLYVTLWRDGRKHRVDTVNWTWLTDLPTVKFNSALEKPESWWRQLRHGDTVMALSEDDVAMPTSGTVDESAETELLPTQVAEMVETDDEVHTTPGEACSTSAKKAKKGVKVFAERVSHGRPRKDRAVDAAQISQARKEYNKGVKLRNVVRGDDLVDVEEFINTCQHLWQHYLLSLIFSR
ncbi:unnamed protein product [Phytophthora fragariaefolia]|uniref:Unnamed protein product n=1 Tax=Phytophthora fragariaefolia TaxID=1490495 RepID=A0A9W6XLX0_9STRA|nr:unnamed protein product [Phytophthora fragariaefolia]